MMFEKFIKFFEASAKRRAINELYRLGLKKEAEALAKQ